VLARRASFTPIRRVPLLGPNTPAHTPQQRRHCHPRIQVVMCDAPVSWIFPLWGEGSQDDARKPSLV
jgi:hypothetical protein